MSVSLRSFSSSRRWSRASRWPFSAVNDVTCAKPVRRLYSITKPGMTVTLAFRPEFGVGRLDRRKASGVDVLGPGNLGAKCRDSFHRGSVDLRVDLGPARLFVRQAVLEFGARKLLPR